MIAFYIINFEEGGFAIISADRRTPKILAFSEKNSFSLNQVPFGVNQWIHATILNIEAVRDKNIKYSGQDKIELFPGRTISHRITTKTILEPVDTLCEPSMIAVEPLLETTWGQEIGYNDRCPVLSGGPGNHAYTGCFTTAIAQIFRYNQYPNLYNYANMPQNIITGVNSSTTQADTVRMLMREIFDHTVLYPSSDVTATGTTTYEHNAKNYLGSYYPYTAKLTYSGTAYYLTVETELNNQHPVIFTGHNSSSSIGHAWVCDGYYRTFFCGENGSFFGGGSSLYLHMNWGYNGNHDGWYGFNSFINIGANLNYNTDIDVFVGLHI